MVFLEKVLFLPNIKLITQNLLLQHSVQSFDCRSAEKQFACKLCIMGVHELCPCPVTIQSCVIAIRPLMLGEINGAAAHLAYPCWFIISLIV